MMINTDDVRWFYRRLNHSDFGLTELVVIDSAAKSIVATGFFDNEGDFVKACEEYSGRYNIYAGRNPRPKWFPKVCENYLDTKQRQRARDEDIQYITAISLDIDPIRPKDTSSTDSQHMRAIDFAMKIQKNTGGWVDDSGNGSYLWIPFETPVKLDEKNRQEVKEKCRLWQAKLARMFQPERYGLRIDGCFDLSRIKKVIGTQAMKGDVHRMASFVLTDENTSDKVRYSILSMQIQTTPAQTGAYYSHNGIKVTSRLPEKFLNLLRNDKAIQSLWLAPNDKDDTSAHDWMLGCELVKSGITDTKDLARILMMNPFGKYQRDRRYDYVLSTVKNLLSSG